MHDQGEVSDLLRAYASQPIGQGVLADATILQEQLNTVCGDDICVYLKIDENDRITTFRHSGHPSMFTLAAASMLAEQIEGAAVEEVLTWGYAFMQDLGFEVSPRRQRSAVIALLATRNALHAYMQDGKIDTYEDLLMS